MSSNPWINTPADIALHPLLQFIDKQQPPPQPQPPQNTENSLLSLSNDHLGNPSSSSSSSSSLSSTSILINRLRAADRIAMNEQDELYRQYLHQNYPEVAAVAKQTKELNQIFLRLSAFFQDFTSTDALRDSYFHTIRASQVQWDDLSQENKGRLIRALRNCIHGIKKLNANRIKTVKVKKEIQVFQEVLERTDILNEEKSFDDFLLDDLHELLTECANLLVLFKSDPSLKDVVNEVDNEEE